MFIEATNAQLTGNRLDNGVNIFRVTIQFAQNDTNNNRLTGDWPLSKALLFFKF